MNLFPTQEPYSLGSAAFSADGGRVLAVRGATSADVGDTRTGRLVGTIRVYGPPPPTQPDTLTIRSAALDATGDTALLECRFQGTPIASHVAGGRLLVLTGDGRLYEGPCAPPD